VDVITCLECASLGVVGTLDGAAGDSKRQARRSGKVAHGAGPTALGAFLTAFLFCRTWVQSRIGSNTRSDFTSNIECIHTAQRTRDAILIEGMTCKTNIMDLITKQEIE